MHRPVVGGTRGMVAAGHPLPAFAGLRVLQEGGNAIDAMVATNAVLAVTQPSLCGIGGDLFALFYDARKKEVTYLNGTGRSAAAATIARLRELGHASMPALGPLAVTVPGCVDAWEAALARYGTRPLAALLAPAIEYAERGFPISHKLSGAIAAGLTRYAGQPGWAANFAPDGRAPEPGGLYRQPALAETLRRIAAGGREEYYRGELARRLVAGIRAAGGLLDEEDFARHEPQWLAPLRTEYRGHAVYTTAPNSQGLTTLLALNILRDFDLAGAGFQSPRALHLMVEAAKVAYAARDRHITDPDFADIPTDALLGDAWAAEARRGLDPERATPPVAPDPHDGRRGDTTYFAVADGAGNLVSCIESNYMGFGSGVVVDGVAFQNRGAYFSLDPEHPNRLEPRKRTMHTLMASLVFRDDRPHLVFGSMGGDAQAQINLQGIANVVDFGRNIQDAIEDPRFVHGRGAGDALALHLEPRYPAGTIEALRAMGHPVEVTAPWNPMMGHAQGIVIGPGDPPPLLGGADPRGDGYAAGW
jgi:gamma-glutamyltranspeptidase/glutathione hydrolase